MSKQSLSLSRARWFSLIAFGTISLSPQDALHAQTTETACPANQQIQKTFSSGAAWEMCWQTSLAEGIVLSNIYYTTPAGTRRRVLGSASVAQIQTDYDDGSSENVMSQTTGLGGDQLLNLQTSECPGGSLHSANSRAVLCETTKPRGYIYKHPNTMRQGDLLELFSVSQQGTRNFAIRWQFYDSGVIIPAAGLTGRLPKTTSNQSHGWPMTAENTIATSFTDHYFWRLDFDLGTNANNDRVEEITSSPSSNRLEKTISKSFLNNETARSTDWENKRFWRIRDSATSNGSVGFISYELVTLNHAHQSNGNNGSGLLANDIFFTRYKACEQLASNNPANNCGSSITQFTNGESLNTTDVVAWYRLSYHHLPRDEDKDRIPLRWNSFELLPRDWSATNPL